MIDLLWTDVDKSIKYLANCITLDNINPNTIVAISRGGLVPATMLSHKLNVDNMCFINVKSYDNTNKASNLDSSPVYGELKSPILIVDDINDTGRTLKYVTNELSGYSGVFTVVVAQKMHTKFIANYVGRRSDESWIQFPWEIT